MHYILVEFMLIFVVERPNTITLNHKKQDKKLFIIHVDLIVGPFYLYNKQPLQMNVDEITCWDSSMRGARQGPW